LRKKRNRGVGWTGQVRSVDVGEKLRLVPYWERGAYESERIQIIIDPGPAFGAGDHPTTLIALELLEAAMIPFAHRAPTMLDVGTGTGVLAIAAKALGSGFTLGLDIDGAAVFTARRNVGLNRLSENNDLEDSVALILGGAECIKEQFDIVAANVAAPLLLRLRSTLADTTGTYLVLSGIGDELIEAVLAAYDSGDLELTRKVERDGWNAVLLRRTSQ
jgi:ribosomal protein L11 methyltransferase